MAWRLHDLIHFHLTAIQTSNLQTDPLKIVDQLLDEDERIDCWITFSPQFEEIYDTFNRIIQKNLRHITTVKQVREFVETCFNQYYEKSNLSLDLDEMLAQVHDPHLNDDMIVIIEFED
jgi:hypothetical protein